MVVYGTVMEKTVKFMRIEEQKLEQVVDWFCVIFTYNMELQFRCNSGWSMTDRFRMYSFTYLQFLPIYFYRFSLYALVPTLQTQF